MSHEDYVSFEQAKALKELGFNWECRQGWVLNGMKIWVYQPYPYFVGVSDNDEYETIPVPTLAQTQKWLREVKGVLITSIPRYSDGETRYQWAIDIQKLRLQDGCMRKPFCDSYETALSAGISKAIEILIAENK